MPAPRNFGFHGHPNRPATAMQDRSSSKTREPFEPQDSQMFNTASCETPEYSSTSHRLFAIAL
jgi:hypothetical protein